MKGITPIISIIILLLITIALAGVAYTFLMGQVYTMISGSFAIPTGGAYCTAGTITIQITNTGSATLTTGDFIIARVDGTDVTASLIAISIGPGEGAVLLDSFNCGGNCGAGPHSIDLSTEQASQHQTIYCA